MLAYALYYNDARIKAYVHALTEQGIDVDIVCLWDPCSKNIASHGANVSLTFIQKKYEGHSLVLYLAHYFHFLFKATFIVAVKHWKNKYSFIHVHNQPDILVLCALIPKLLGARIILDKHDIMMAGVLTKFTQKKGFLFFMTKLQTWISVKLSDILICSDHSQLDYLHENGIDHPTSFVIMNVPDGRIFRRREQMPANTILRLVYHGTLAHRLGLDLAIRAVERVSRTIRLSFTIIGEGNQKQDLLRLCEELHIQDTLVSFKNFIPVEDLPAELEHYDIGIIANRKTLLGEQCMLPVKLMEYLAIGIPVIAPRLAAIQRYFSETMVAYYEPENIIQLADTIIMLANNPGHGQAMVQESDKFFTIYNWTDQKKQYLQNIVEVDEK